MSTSFTVNVSKALQLHMRPTNCTSEKLMKRAVFSSFQE